MLLPPTMTTKKTSTCNPSTPKSPQPVPDVDYLTDLPGLIAYLGEKIAVGNVCIYCNEKGRAFRSAEAVRKHMVDKGHCKIAYDTQKDRLEVSDYYDFTKSYPEGSSGKKSKKNRLVIEGAPAEADEEWEDVSDDGEGDEDMEIVDEDASSEDEDMDSDDAQLTYGDSPFELVLPSGARIGHRSMRRYYAQSFYPVGDKKEEDPNTGAALVRRLLSDKNSQLVPVKGGFGAFGAGSQVVKARNRGEAREAGRHVREFRDMKRREEFKTKMGFVGNNQKHFRDPRAYSLIQKHFDLTDSSPFHSPAVIVRPLSTRFSVMYMSSCVVDESPIEDVLFSPYGCPLWGQSETWLLGAYLLNVDLFFIRRAEVGAPFGASGGTYGCTFSPSFFLPSASSQVTPNGREYWRLHLPSVMPPRSVHLQFRRHQPHNLGANQGRRMQNKDWRRMDV